MYTMSERDWWRRIEIKRWGWKEKRGGVGGKGVVEDRQTEQHKHLQVDLLIIRTNAQKYRLTFLSLSLTIYAFAHTRLTQDITHTHKHDYCYYKYAIDNGFVNLWLFYQENILVSQLAWTNKYLTMYQSISLYS